MSELQIVRFRGDVQSGCYIIFGMKYDLCWRLESEAVFIVVSAEISRRPGRPGGRNSFFQKQEFRPPGKGNLSLFR